jgi:hypothetical protein
MEQNLYRVINSLFRWYFSLPMANESVTQDRSEAEDACDSWGGARTVPPIEPILKTTNSP